MAGRLAGYSIACCQRENVACPHDGQHPTPSGLNRPGFFRITKPSFQPDAEILRGSCWRGCHV